MREVARGGGEREDTDQNNKQLCEREGASGQRESDEERGMWTLACVLVKVSKE